jgi:acyl dehydratase
VAQTMTRRITQAMINRYGRINGDNDIIHYDEDYARQRGFRGTLAHGLMLMGYAAELAAREYGKDWYTRGEIKTKWIKPVCPGDQLTVALDDNGALQASVDDGSLVMLGEAKLAPA